MAHPKARLTPFGRRLLVRRVREEGWPVAHIAAAMGVSRQCAHRWLARFDEEGEAGMFDRSSRPHRSPTQTAPEVEAKGARREGSGHAKGDLDFSLAVLYTRGDLAHRGAAFIESVWKIPADYQLELIPTDVLEMLYPAPYAGALIKHAPQRNVDPRFLLAIMRQESRFRADVKSFAAARGLMQFISTTSARVAAALPQAVQETDCAGATVSFACSSCDTGAASCNQKRRR